MKILSPIFALLLLLGLQNMNAQVTCDPYFPHQTDNITLYFHADEGNAALAGISPPIYIHTGVICNHSANANNWQHIATTWTGNNATSLMDYVSPNLYKKTIQINSFYNIPAGDVVKELTFVFRNANGSIVGRAADGSDIHYTVYPNDGSVFTQIIAPTAPVFLANLGDEIPFHGLASTTANLTLYDNGQPITNITGTELQTTLTATTAGSHVISLVAETAADQDTSQFVYVVASAQTPLDPPAGTEAGITYLTDHSVRLALYAPQKQIVHAVGDFNDWLPTAAYQMHQSVDGNLWWIDIDNLTPGQAYRFQYLVDGSLKIADPRSTLVLDYFNDPYIPAATYPNLPPYPIGKTFGTVSVLKTGEPAFNWQNSSYQRPKKTDLVIYELLVRDFLARHDYPTMLDTLDYLQALGVTAIELMPVSEFDGNINWGYAPQFHKALDKYYGDKASLQQLIDACHARGIAVLLDVVFNQATGASPLAQLYWDAANNRPAANNPWLNPVATHPFSVFNDFNHESAATKDYVKNCLQYWIETFQVDGFRFDLSKGFTQFNSGSNVGLWGQYDASRVAILKDYADFIWSVDPEEYVILEHFADNTEEKELSNYGMMLWGNAWGQYKDVALAFTTGINTSLTGVSYKARGWTDPHLIGYMESHDEDRIAYECLTYGNQAVGHNVRTLPVALKRIEMLQNLFYTVPGPKMLWEFGEMGYDFHINRCEDGSVSPDCRTSPKPIRWDYLNNPERRHLHDVVAALLHLRTQYDVFETADFQLNTGPGKIRNIRLNSPAMNVHVLANVATTTETATANFQHTGWWYDYYTGDSVEVTNTAMTFSLPAAGYRLYTDHYIALPPGIVFTDVKTPPQSALASLSVWPNPAPERVEVAFSLKENAALAFELLDVAGKRLRYWREGALPEGPHAVTVDMPAGAGLYFLKITDPRGVGAVVKIIRN